MYAIKEKVVERYFVKRVKERGGEARKVQWIGRRNAPDWVAMLPGGECGNGSDGKGTTLWVEFKNPDTIKTFPANAHERAQHREHKRMRRMGQRVEVIGTIEQVEELLS